MGGLLLSAALAAPAHSPAATRENLRPLWATPADVEDGKQIAQRFCADCHGPAGITSIPDVPNLAGQRGPYLLSEMRAFLAGERGNDTMNGAITYLTPTAMSNVAAYYASQDPAQPAVTGARADIDPMQSGRAAASGCAGCHGDAGVSKMPGVPNLVGLDPKYLVGAMAAYENGERKNHTMKVVLAAVPPTSWDNIAFYYSQQKASRAETPVGGDAAAGQAASPPCAACHGAEGISSNPASPSLAGQESQYLATALHAYKEGARSNSTMKALATVLDEAAIKNLAAYYASQQPQAPNVPKPLTTSQWAERCNRCHGVNGNSTDPLIPSLTGQSQSYLMKVLNAYRTGTRRSVLMGAMSANLSENDIRSLAAYYAAQKSRAVIYVPLPNQ